MIDIAMNSVLLSGMVGSITKGMLILQRGDFPVIVKLRDGLKRVHLSDEIRVVGKLIPDGKSNGSCFVEAEHLEIIKEAQP